MKNPEEAIEKVLAGLGNPEAPAGLKRRILKALEDRVLVRSRWGRRWFRPVWLVTPVRPIATRYMVCGAAIAGAFAIASATPMIRWFGQVPAPSKMISAPLPADASEGPVKSAQLSPLRSDVRSMNRVTSEGKVNVRRTVATSKSDSLAFDEMHAVSHSAPPMPLTEQEKMLLRIAHKGDPVEFAELDPVQRAAHDAEEKAEVKKFFLPTTTGDNE